jgi:adenosine deaminase
MKLLKREITRGFWASLPKIHLHDHLDGTIRPQTLIELAKDSKYTQLPTKDPVALAKWFSTRTEKSLPHYLKGYHVTTEIMQSEEALERISYEFMEDHKKDGLIHVEPRFAPWLHTRRGLDERKVMSSILKGLENGRRDFGLDYGVIICVLRAMMTPEQSVSTATWALEFKNRGVVALDVAGPEKGFPNRHYKDALLIAKKGGLNLTVHAGEDDGLESIQDAIDCGAQRIGHGIRLMDDIQVHNNQIKTMGKLAQHIHSKGITLENCITSNFETGVVPNFESHPFHHFLNHGFKVTLNTDGSLMTDVTLSEEYRRAHEVFGLKFKDLHKATINAAEAAFVTPEKRSELIKQVNEFYKHIPGSL